MNADAAGTKQSSGLLRGVNGLTFMAARGGKQRSSRSRFSGDAERRLRTERRVGSRKKIPRKAEESLQCVCFSYDYIFTL